ncbi:hypothetical protein HAX54_041752, partial [Datura stramonium]|nr:hypothetical protein [Datura stramonium]
MVPIETPWKCFGNDDYHLFTSRVQRNADGMQVRSNGGFRLLNFITRYIGGSWMKPVTRPLVVCRRPVAPIYCFSPSVGNDPR